MGKNFIEVPTYEMSEDVKVNPQETALLIVDMQNDFCLPEGKLLVPDAQKTVPAIKKLLSRARSVGMPVFYTQDWHYPDDPEFDIWGEHTVSHSWGANIIDALTPLAHERVIRKTRYDGFYGTSLDHELRILGVDTLIICGTVANICVHYTAASAALRWYKVILPKDALSALTPFDMEATCRQVAHLFGGVITQADSISMVNSNNKPDTDTHE